MMMRMRLLDPLPKKDGRRTLCEGQFGSPARPDFLYLVRLLVFHPFSPHGPLDLQSLAPASRVPSRRVLCSDSRPLLGCHYVLMAALALHLHNQQLRCVLLGPFPCQTRPFCLSPSHPSARMLAAVPQVRA